MKGGHIIGRGPHHFDVLLEKGKARRTIRNHCSYRLPGRDYQETKFRATVSAGVPAHWPDSVPFPFSLQSLESPLQSFFGDKHDPDNEARVRARLASDPDCWIDIKAIDALPSRTVQDDERTARWPGLWRKTTLYKQTMPDKLYGELRLERPGHSEKFRYSLDVPDGMRIEFANNTARILDDQGVERMHILAPQGWDSSTVNPDTLDGRKLVRVTMREAGTIRVDGRTCVVVELEPNKDDLVGATYPVIIEQNPTVQITGQADIEDIFVWSGSIQLTHNYGANLNQLLSAPGVYYRNALTRISLSSIPVGTITGFRAYLYRTDGEGQDGTVFFVADANDWIEGTANGTPQTGSACWNQCKLNEQNWAGHPTLGCMKSGDDFDADPTPPTFTIDLGWNVATLDPAWPPLWRDGVRAVNGMIFFKDVSFHMAWYSSESATNPQYFEIDYEAIAASPATMLSRRIHE